MTRCMAVLLLALLAGCGGGAPFTVHGSLDVAGSVQDSEGKGAPCDSSGHYPDIDAGTQVVVTDGDGRAAGVGVLEPGRLAGGRCRYPFEVDDVKGGSDLYTVAIGTRGYITFKRSEASAVRLTLG